MGIFRGTGGTGDATTDAVASQVGTDAATASTKANEAANSATDAANSATAAATSATNSGTSETIFQAYFLLLPKICHTLTLLLNLFFLDCCK